MTERREKATDRVPPDAIDSAFEVSLLAQPGKYLQVYRVSSPIKGQKIRSVCDRGFNDEKIFPRWGRCL